jgi:peptidoglycan/LPS O-acetylase OafA/YrhL
VRFLAALHVVLFHVREAFVGIPEPLMNILRHGNLGVNLFFILSGFVLAYTYLVPGRERIDRRNFWVARFARIYPLYIFAALLAAPRVLVKGDIPRESLVPTIVSTVSLTQAWTGLIDWNIPAWSLSVEAFFYLLFPVVAVWVCRLEARGLIVAMAAFWLASQVVPLLYVSAGRPLVWRDVVLYNPVLRLPEFLIGIALGRLFMRRTEIVRRRMTVCAWGSAAALALIMAVGSRMPGELLHNGLLDPLFATLIFGLAGTGGFLVRLFGNRAMVILGEASYGVYILQQPVASWFKAVASVLLVGGLGAASDLKASPAFMLAYVAVLVAFSVLTYYLLEIPSRTAIRRWWTSERAVAVVVDPVTTR